MSRYGEWSPRFSSKESFSWFPRKEHTTGLSSFFFPFQATSSRKKTPGTKRQYTYLSAEGKALVSKSPSFHHSHSGTSWAAWLLGSISLRRVSPSLHMHSMCGYNFAFCIPQPPLMKATLLLKYLWCSCSESLSSTFPSGK